MASFHVGAGPVACWAWNPSEEIPRNNSLGDPNRQTTRRRGAGWHHCCSGAPGDFHLRGTTALIAIKGRAASSGSFVMSYQLLEHRGAFGEVNNQLKTASNLTGR